MPRITIQDIQNAKENKDCIAMTTAYDATFAQLFDSAGIEVLLVGDSLGMVIQGKKNTLSVTLDEMIYHSRCVARASQKAHLLFDMPFMSFQVSTEQAISNCGRALKESGAQSVKLEGGLEMSDKIQAVVNCGIPVMGHVGLKPQHVHLSSGFKKQGQSEKSAKSILKDAKAVEAAGAYAIVLENIPDDLGEKITKSLKIPTIGIGAGPHCDGQVLVGYDFLGLTPHSTPKFVKKFADLKTTVIEATQKYIQEIKHGQFPS